MEFENWLTRSQVAKALSISGEYVQNLTVAGRLTFITTPLGRLYDPESVEQALASGVGHIRRRA